MICGRASQNCKLLGLHLQVKSQMALHKRGPTGRGLITYLISTEPLSQECVRVYTAGYVVLRVC